jgi:hypothetical protein
MEKDTRNPGGEAFSGVRGGTTPSSKGDKKNMPGDSAINSWRILSFVLTLAAFATGESLGGTAPPANHRSPLLASVGGKIMLWTLGVGVVAALCVGYIVIAAIAKSW